MPAVVALTVILSLGSILRPVQEYGVGPQQVLSLLAYFLPITLTFVLPMGALFASSLVYGRFASDNELDACRASGVSLLTLVYPGLILAFIVAIANLFLSFQVMPAFVHRAEKSLKADAKQILFRNIQRTGYYRLPPDKRYVVYADQAQGDTLYGVVVVEVQAWEVKKIIAAQRAEVKVDPHERFNEVQITAYNTYQVGPKGEEGAAESLFLTAEFGSLLGDDIKFKDVGEMKEIRDKDLTLFYPIAKLARETYAQLITELLAQDISTELANDANNLYELYSGERFVEFTAGSCGIGDEKEVKLLEEVVVIESDVTERKRLRTLRCAEAALHIEGDELAPIMTLVLDKPNWQRPDGTEGRAWGRIRIRGLVLPNDVASRLQTQNVLRAVSDASVSSILDRNGPSYELRHLQEKLKNMIAETLAEIKAEIHSRLVFGIGCISVIMIGIGLGIMLKGGHLLSAFGVSSIPAAVLIVCIMMGKNITKNLGAQASPEMVSGIVLMWAGVGFLFLLALALYAKLLRS